MDQIGGLLSGVYCWISAVSRIAFRKGAQVSCEKEGSVISQQTLTSYIRESMPDAVVTVIDKTGTMDHLQVVVLSDAFLGKNLLDRHRMIYQALDGPMKDGRIHALEITAKTKEESEKEAEKWQTR